MESVAALVESLKKYRILEAPRIAEIEFLEERFADSRGLGRELVQRGWLTPFQINRLLQNRAQDLVLGSYVLLEQLGQGGMGQVFKARHLRLDRIDAVKVIRKEYLDRPNALERFQREARAAARLAHPNVVTVYDAGEVHGVHFLAMEYAAGTDLARLVKQGGPLPIAQACDYIRQAALGLQHVHERQLIHRDVKPSNLLLTTDGTVKLLDLGLARLGTLGTDATSPSLTDTGTVLGTADFISPEQARDARDVDIRADIYSLGCTLYYLLTGQIPFPGETLTAKLLAHQLEESPPVESLRPDVPPALAALVRRLMAKQPAERLQTPAEVASALQGGAAPQAVPVLAHSAVLTPVPAHDGLTLAHALEDTVPAARRPRGAQQRGPLLLLVGGALALTLLFVCGGLLLLFGGRGTEQAATARLTVRPTAGTRPPTTPDKVQAKVHFERGLAWHDGRQWDKAIAEYTLALRCDPDGAHIYTNRGACYRAQGDQQAALRDYTRAIELNPRMPEAFYNRAHLYYAAGDLDRCLADHTAAIQLRPNYAPGFNNRGTVYSKKKMFPEALRDFDQAIKLDEQYSSAYHNRGSVYFDMGKLAPALADLDRAIALEPTAASSFDARGKIHLARGDADRALADFDRAIELSPKFAPAYWHRSQAHAKKGNAERADADRRQALKLNPALANAP